MYEDINKESSLQMDERTSIRNKTKKEIRCESSQDIHPT